MPVRRGLVRPWRAGCFDHHHRLGWARCSRMSFVGPGGKDADWSRPAQ
jgi:hypothetical protein